MWCRHRKYTPLYLLVTGEVPLTLEDILIVPFRLVLTCKSVEKGTDWKHDSLLMASSKNAYLADTQKIIGGHLPER